MFLSSRGIYIIVLDLTKGLEQKLSTTRKDRLGYDVTDNFYEQTPLGVYRSCFVNSFSSLYRRWDNQCSREAESENTSLVVQSILGEEDMAHTI